MRSLRDEHARAMNTLGSQGLEKVVVVLPAYNAARTLENTFRQFPKDFRAHFILVDDHSQDRTVEVAKSLNIDTVIKHDSNFGYGANQKTCYREALRQGATIIVMLHPDSQYNPQLVPVFVELIKSRTCDIVLGNRIRSRRDALLGGMPKYKYYANRALTLAANICLGTNLGDFHTGFRVYSRAVLESVSWESNANDFSFDPEFLTKAVLLGFRIGDVPIPCSYPPHASSIDFQNSVVYGFKMLLILLKYLLTRLRMATNLNKHHQR
jgi:glycosyltransferase involved in cell wall biosynthesis